MPVYGVLLAFNLSILDFTPYSVKLVFTLVTLAFTVAVPALLVLLLKRMGLVTDVGLNGRKERVIPYIISILCLAAAGVFMWYKGAPMWLVMFFGGGAVGRSDKPADKFQMEDFSTCCRSCRSCCIADTYNTRRTSAGWRISMAAYCHRTFRNPWYGTGVVRSSHRMAGYCRLCCRFSFGHSDDIVINLGRSC